MRDVPYASAHLVYCTKFYVRNRGCVSVNRLSGGSLGSHNDEERSKARYELRIAELVNHHIFERIMQQQTSVCSYAFLSVKS